MSSHSDPELDRILEELLADQRRGQTLELDALTARYPQYADELKGFLADAAFLSPLFAEARCAFGAGVSRGGTIVPVIEPHESASSVLPGLNGFRILEELGSGSQGVVYKALQLGTRRTVALKVIRDGLFASIKERLRFENEIRVAAQLKHPNVVAVYGSGSERGHEYFFMEYADGEPLDLYLSTHTLTIPQTVQLFLPICDAVGCAHLHGIIHRDLKPANVLVDQEGQPHVLDFGLAKRVDEAERAGITQAGSFAGTWYYASPEQVRPQDRGADVRSDVYALGVMLYEAVTDAFPYPIAGAGTDMITSQILSVDPIRPSLIRRDVGDELETIILQALQKAGRRTDRGQAGQPDLCAEEGVSLLPAVGRGGDGRVRPVAGVRRHGHGPLFASPGGAGDLRRAGGFRSTRSGLCRAAPR